MLDREDVDDEEDPDIKNPAPASALKSRYHYTNPMLPSQALGRLGLWATLSSLSSQPWQSLLTTDVAFKHGKFSTLTTNKAVPPAKNAILQADHMVGSIASFMWVCSISPGNLSKGDTQAPFHHSTVHLSFLDLRSFNHIFWVFISRFCHSFLSDFSIHT